MPPAIDEELAHRHLDLLVEGPRPSPERRARGGPRLERADLRGFRGEAPP